MNKIYKVIWSKAKHTYVVASEIAKGHTKGETTGKGLKKLAAALLVAAALMGPNFAWAADIVSVTDTSTTQQTVYTKGGADDTFATKGSLTTEATDRANADSTLQTSIDNEVTNRKAADSTLQTNIENEATNRKAADTTLQSNIDKEAADREAADTKLQTAVDAKANAADVYSKTETDTKLADKANAADVYSKTETDTKLADKANAADVYSKTETDAKLGDKANAADVYSKTETDTKLADKANAADVYSKTETDTKLADKANTADVYSKTDADAKFATNDQLQKDVAATNLELANKANKATTLSGYGITNAYTKDEVDEADTKLQKSIDEEARKRKYSVTNLENADKQLQTNIDTEAKAREAGDKELDTRITNVKEYLENQTSENYVSKADAAVQDAGVVKADKKIGENVTALGKGLYDETAARIGADAAQDKVIKQVNDNLVASVNTINKNVADGFTALNQAGANEAAAREAKDNELNKRITNEANAIHDEIKAGDKVLDTRITNVKEYLENQTSENYVSKADAAVQDAGVVKADKKIGENVTALGKGLYDETAARIGADKAQDKVIQQVNDNLVQSVNTINKNVADGFTALNAADANETKARADADAAEKAARIGADAKLVEAVNSSISLSADNVLQKNTTTVDADGNVTTGKADVTEMILNKGGDHQITLSEKGIKVGTNSTVMDKDGVYTGGDTYSEAKAALKSDGSIKGADGKFTVNSANGTVNVNDQIELNGATGVVKANSLNVGDGNMTVSSNGNIKSAGTLSVADGNFKVNSNGGVSAAGGKTTLASDGSIKAADGKFTVNSNGGVKAADGKITLSSDGSVKAADGKFTVNSNGAVKAADGKFTVDSNGAVKAANGNTTIDSNGNLSTKGTVSAANGKFSVDTNGKITSTGLDAGSGTIQTTGTVQAGDVKTGTLETTGDAKIGGNLTVEKNLTVNGEFNAKTLASRLDENNYTEIHGGNVTSKNRKYSASGELQASSSKMDETGSTVWARDDESIGKSTVTADSVKQSLSDTGDNAKNYASREIAQHGKNTYEMTDSVVEGNRSNITKTTADTTDSQIALKDDDGNVLNKSYITQNLKKILQGVEEGNSKTTIEQDANNITNAAANGTITNDAKDIVNKASGNMTTTVGGEMSTTVTGKVTEDYKSDLSTKVGGNETHAVTGSQSTVVAGDQTNTVSGNKTESVKGDVNESYGSLTTNVKNDSSLTAENISNTAKNKITNKALDVETDAASSIVSKVSNDYGFNTSTQTSNETKEAMSQADGKTASYLRGAAEEKSQLIDGSKKTTIDTIAGQTNTNITDGTNTSNDLQKADQIASSVTDGTNTTVVNQNAKSLASSITDGTKANNTNSTVDKSEQLIKASDTHFYAETRTAEKAEEALRSGNTVINIVKDTKTATVSSAVTDGATITGISQNAKDISLSAAGGTITNTAKKLVNTATGDMENKVGGNLTNNVTGNMTSNVTGDSSLSAKNITNTAEEKLSNSAAEIENSASKSITDKVGANVERTMTTEKIQDKVGKTTVTTTEGLTKLTNEDGKHKTEMDFADVLKDLGVRGNAAVDGNTTLGKEGAETTLTVNSTSTFNKDVTMKENLDVKGTTTTTKLVVNNGAAIKGGATVTGGTTTDTLHVTSTATFDDIVTMKKDLSVGGNVDAASYTVKDTDIKIDKNGINAGGTKVTGLAPADISHAGSTDAVSGGQLYETNTRVSGLETRMGTVETRVDKLDGKIDKVGANAAAMANLHPLEFDEDSKWNIAAAVGSSGSETASAVGVFYRPNENVMVNASAAMGTGENMFGGGVSLRLGHGGNKAKEAQMKAAAAENKELRAKVDDLTARMDALLSVLNPNMSKDFPDVPENHWAYEAVSRLAGNGIVEGYEDGKYHGERQMTRYEMAEIIYNALSKGAKAEKKLVEEFRPELQAMAAQKKA